MVPIMWTCPASTMVSDGVLNMNGGSKQHQPASSQAQWWDAAFQQHSCWAKNAAQSARLCP